MTSTDFTFRPESLMPPTAYEWAAEFFKAHGPHVDPREVYRQAYRQVASATYAMHARDAYNAHAFEAITGQPF